MKNFDKLAASKKIEDKLKAAQDPECPAEALDKIVMDGSVPWGTEMGDTLANAIASNSNCPAGHLATIYENPTDDGQRLLVLQNPTPLSADIVLGCVKSESIGSELITAIAERSDLDDLNREIVDLKIGLGKLIQENKSSDNTRLLQDAFLSVTDWGKDIYDALYKDKNPDVRNALAMNPSLPESILLELSNDSDIRVILSVISNPSCPIKILKITSEDKESIFGNWIRESVALNINTPKNIIKVLLKDDCRWVREAASSHESIEKSTITKLIKNGDRYVLKGLLTNPNSSVNIKSQIEEMLKDEETYPIHYIDLAQNDSYENIDGFHTDRFFEKCISEGQFIYESVDSDEYDMDELEGQDEEWFNENQISAYGTRTYLYGNEHYQNGTKKFFQISIYIPNYEGCAINIEGLEEVLDNLSYEAYYDIEELLECHPWLCDYRDIIDLIDRIEKNNN